MGDEEKPKLKLTLNLAGLTDRMDMEKAKKKKKKKKEEKEKHKKKKREKERHEVDKYFEVLLRNKIAFRR